MWMTVGKDNEDEFKDRSAFYTTVSTTKRAAELQVSGMKPSRPTKHDIAFAVRRFGSGGDVLVCARAVRRTEEWLELVKARIVNKANRGLLR